jgi:hypothetical protein
MPPRATDEPVAASNIVVRLDCDAGLDTQNDTKLMVRRHGVLTLYGDWRPWHEPHVIARIPAPFERAPTPLVP